MGVHDIRARAGDNGHVGETVMVGNGIDESQRAVHERHGERILQGGVRRAEEVDAPVDAAEIERRDAVRKVGGPPLGEC